MLGLMMKDIYQLKSYTRVFLAVVIFCIVLGFSGEDAIFLTFYPGVLMGMMPITLFAYDEKAKFHTLLSALPVKKGTYVSAKYIMGFFLILLACIATGVVQASKMIQSGTFVASEFLMVIVLALSIGMIAPAVVLPMIFWLGTEKGRFVNIIVVVIAFSLIKIFMDMESDFQLFSDAKLIVFAIAGSAVLIYAVSWIVSTLVFSKKEY